MNEQLAQPKLMREILDSFKDSIRAGKLGMGERLPSERQMAEDFGVSRTTIREALKALETMGLIHCVQGGGNYIPSNFDHCLTEPLTILFMLQSGSIPQVHQLRRALELEAMRVAPLRVTDADIVRLYSICDRIEADPLEHNRAMLDQQLHYELAAISGNPLFNVILGAASDLIETHIKNVRANMLAEGCMLDRINQQHRAIVDSLALRDIALSQSAMARHLDALERYIVKRVEAI